MHVSKVTNSKAGFSIMELLIAMSIMLVVMSCASTFLAGSLRIRGREMARIAALADAQRALNTMSREIANSGFGLTSNGIVTANSDASSIRRRANLNSYTRTATHTVNEQDEDVMFSLQANPDGSSALIRSDIGLGQARVLASPVNALSVRYYNSAGAEITDGTENNATRVKITLTITLPAVGPPRSPGYQPPSAMQVASDITLRNSNLFTY
jgi:prepilin-type N-terminal cleavage/methylation domain-containing protein